jgi:L,D-transpeptidase ErfK/SrfK
MKIKLPETLIYYFMISSNCLHSILSLFSFLIFVFLTSCNDINKKSFALENPISIINDSIHRPHIDTLKIVVKKDVPIRTYFKWMDSLVNVFNKKSNYAIDEYVLVKANLWILDTLAHTDYYYLKEKEIFNEDSQSLIVLQKGQILFFPDSLQTHEIKERMANTYIDVNIPEFKLRIIENGKELFKFPVRVGQNKKTYLAMANGEVDLRTKSGIGTIVRVNKSPAFINPKNNHKYYTTKRDDNKVTKLPAIPWVEPEINGQRFGQLIHPTTNMATLGKAFSNGCIGLRESDAWFLYYYAPLTTKIVIRYDLQGKDDEGKDILFTNIYPGFENKTYRKETIEARLKAIDGKPITVCDCRNLN